MYKSGNGKANKSALVKDILTYMCGELTAAGTAPDFSTIDEITGFPIHPAHTNI
jgi:hypothetical protein